MKNIAEANIGSGSGRSPEVSVIIPTYNRSDVIKDAIESVLNQTYRNFEIIIIDDGSTDNTEEVVKKLIKENSDRKMEYIKIKHSGLPARARNEGIKRAMGKLIAFLDSDDLWLPEKLKLQIETLKNDKDILGVSSAAVTFPVNIPMKAPKKDKKISLKELLKTNIIATSSVILKKEVFDKIGYFDENPDLRAVEDFDLWLRILNYRDKSIKILSVPLVKYRVSPDSVQGTKNIEFFLNRMKKMEVILSKLEFLSNKQKEKLRRKWYSRAYNHKMYSLLNSGEIGLFDYLKEKNIRASTRIRYTVIYLIKKIIKRK